jgi:hypothetical protein
MSERDFFNFSDRLEPMENVFRLGRNDPCPCGSPKKYKKCCALKGLSPERVFLDAYSKLTFSEDLEETPTVDIVNELDRLGAKSLDVESFVALAKNSTATFEIAEVWSDETGKQLTRPETSYLEAAAEVLWDRRCPEIRSTETLIEWIQGAKELFYEDQEEAIHLLWKTWSYLTPKMTTEMSTIADAEHLLAKTGYSLHELMVDLEMALSGKLLTEDDYQDIAIRFAQKALDQFHAQDPLSMEHIELKLAEAFWLKGQFKESTEVYSKMITERPHRSAGYVGWADALTQYSIMMGRPAQNDQAREILEQALRFPVEDPEDWELQELIDELE